MIGVIALLIFHKVGALVMDIEGIKREFGDLLAFFGGMSTQKTLPYATPDEVKTQTAWLIEKIGAGGGYIFSPAHDVPKDVPPENMAAMLEVLKNQQA